MFILEITSESCNDLVLAKILSLLHTIFNIIGIAVPILLTVSAVISLISMLTNPEQKDGMKKIINKFMAAVIVFFIPTITDLAIQLVPGTSFSVSACWKTADNAASNITYANTDEQSNWKKSSKGDLGGNLQLLEKYANTANISSNTGDTSNNSGGTTNTSASCDAQVPNIIFDGTFTTNAMPIPVYFQDKPGCDWGEFRKGQTVAGGGCGFTSLAMILSYLTGKTITPGDMAKRYPSYYNNKKGMAHILVDISARDYGLKKPKEISANDVRAALKNGHPVLARGEGNDNSNGLFSVGPHFIVLRAIDGHEGIYINNPTWDRRAENTQPFTLRTIKKWATKYWSFPAKAN